MPKSKEEILSERQFIDGLSDLKKDLAAALAEGKITQEESDFLIQLEHKLGHPDYPIAEDEELDRGEAIAVKIWPDLAEPPTPEDLQKA